MGKRREQEIAKAKAAKRARMLTPGGESRYARRVRERGYPPMHQKDYVSAPVGKQD